MYGSASARICALSAVLTASSDMETSAGAKGRSAANARIVLRTRMPHRPRLARAVSANRGASRRRGGFLVLWTTWQARCLTRFRCTSSVARSSPSCATTATCCSPRRCSRRSSAPRRRVEIDALVYRETAPMLAGHPAIAQVHTIDRDWKKRGVVAQARERVARCCARLRARDYDLLVHLTEHPRGLTLARLLRPRYAVTRERDKRARAVAPSLHALLPRCPRAPSGTWSSRTWTRCAGSACIRTRPTAGSCWCRAPTPSDASTQLLAEHGLAPREFVQVHPGSRWLFKCWPAERTAALVDLIVADGLAVVLTGAPDDRERALDDRGAGRRAPADARAHVDLTGTLSLRGARRADGARPRVRRRRFGADAHRRRGGHADARVVRSVERDRVGPVARRAARDRVGRVPVPAVRPRRLRRRQGLRVPDHAAGRARARGVRRAARAIARRGNAMRLAIIRQRYTPHGGGRALPRRRARGAARAQRRDHAVHARVAADQAAAHRAVDRQSVPRRRAVARLGLRARRDAQIVARAVRTSCSRTSSC